VATSKSTAKTIFQEVLETDDESKVLDILKIAIEEAEARFGDNLHFLIDITITVQPLEAKQ
jgi:hypothetical protein